MKKLILGAVALQIAIFGILVILPAETRTQPASAQQTIEFHHSQCQYPTRTTNPPNGCDNSDPCDPTNVKGGSGDCLPQSNTVEPKTAHPTPVKKSKSLNQCGGK